MEKLPISLCLFVKDEEEVIANCIESVFPVVSEVAVVITGNNRNTFEICKKYTNIIYKVGFSDFGSIRTLSAHLASFSWVLMLDADERLDAAGWPKLAELINYPDGVQGDNGEIDRHGRTIIDSWALPRKRWADPWMNKQEEVEAYPDWQVRLFKNHSDKRIHFTRRVHETIKGCIRTEKSIEGPIIHHFQNVNKTKKEQQERRLLYKRLYDADLAEGIEHTEPPIAAVDIEDAND